MQKSIINDRPNQERTFNSNRVKSLGKLFKCLGILGTQHPHEVIKCVVVAGQEVLDVLLVHGIIGVVEEGHAKVEHVVSLTEELPVHEHDLGLCVEDVVAPEVTMKQAWRNHVRWYQGLLILKVSI